MIYIARKLLQSDHNTKLCISFNMSKESSVGALEVAELLKYRHFELRTCDYSMACLIFAGYAGKIPYQQPSNGSIHLS